MENVFMGRARRLLLQLIAYSRHQPDVDVVKEELTAGTAYFVQQEQFPFFIMAVGLQSCETPKYFIFVLKLNKKSLGVKQKCQFGHG